MIQRVNNEEKHTLWTRNFTLIIAATVFGSAGAIAGEFAMSFFVFDETKSTLASALVMAIQVIPGVILPLLISPIMDRLPRKLFLVAGDFANGIISLAMGIYLMFFEFSYIGYLFISMAYACLGAVDELAFDSIFPQLIPKGFEQKGYSVSSMTYPILNVVMMPLAAVLLDTIGVPVLLMIQGVLWCGAAVLDNMIELDETHRIHSENYSPTTWFDDMREAASYLKNERGLSNLIAYVTISDGVTMGWYPILVAFFRSTPGFNPGMYAMLSVAEFAGRSVGTTLQYATELPKEKKFGFNFAVYQIYDLLDTIMLWMSYPFMVASRVVSGFLGGNSSIIRYAAVQSYIPDELRARINSFQSVLFTVSSALFTLVIGALGEVLDYRICVSIFTLFAYACSWIFVWGNKADIKKVYEVETKTPEEPEDVHP